MKIVSKKFSLKSKLILSYVMMSLFLISSLLLVSNYFLEKRFQSYIIEMRETKNNNIVELVAESFGAENQLPDETTLQTIGSTALAEGLILMVDDGNGNQMFCMTDNFSELCSDMLDGMSTRMASLYPHFKGEYEQKEYPIIKDEVQIGTVTLGYYGPFFYNEEDVQFLSMLNQIFWIVGLLFLIIAAGLGIWMSNHIVRPILKVIDKTKQIEEGNYQYRLETYSDTKEINQLIHSVNALAQTLDRQQTSKRQMARNYSHEFRTPLATLQLNLEAMIDGIYEPTPQRLESCREEILRLTRMAGEINNLVKLEEDTAVLKMSEFDLAQLVNQTIVNFEPSITAKQIQLKIDLRSCTVYADQDKIAQAVVNLISNAYKYTDEGGMITVTLKKEKDQAILVVSDTGIGISKQDKPFIFEYLYRGDPSRDRKTGGAGIGLSLVEAIARAHDGSVTVFSEEGKGSSFRLTIPSRC